MIKINNLTKKYKDKLAVDNLNLEIKTGELFSLLGTNGAGKTTTIKMLSTLILPTSGEVEINNLDLVKDSSKIKEIINISPQETAVASNLTVLENLYFMAGIYQIPNKEDKINHKVGFVITKKVGEYVTDNEELVKVYMDKKDININELLSCFEIGPSVENKQSLIIDIID